MLVLLLEKLNFLCLMNKFLSLWLLLLLVLIVFNCQVAAQHTFCDGIVSRNCIVLKQEQQQQQGNDDSLEATEALSVPTQQEDGTDLYTSPTTKATFKGNFLKDKNYYKGYHRLNEVLVRDNVDTDSYLTQQEAISTFDKIRDDTIPGSITFGGKTCVTSCEWLSNAAGVPLCSQCKRPFAIYDKLIGSCIDFTLPRNSLQLSSLLGKCQRFAQCKCTSQQQSQQQQATYWLTSAIKQYRLVLNINQLIRDATTRNHMRSDIQRDIQLYFKQKSTTTSRSDFLYAFLLNQLAFRGVSRIQSKSGFYNSASATTCSASEPYFPLMFFDDIIDGTTRSNSKLSTPQLIELMKAKRETLILNLVLVGACAGAPDMFIYLKPMHTSIEKPALYEYRNGQVLTGGSNSERQQQLAKEDLMRSFREDPWIESAHNSWHQVWLNTGYPFTYNFKASSRIGEVFYYFHNQIIARYNAERIAYGLPRVEALKYDEPYIGYNDNLGSENQKIFLTREYGLTLPKQVEPEKGMLLEGKEMINGHYTKLMAMVDLFKQNGFKPTSDLFANAMSEMGSGAFATFHSASTFFEPYFHPMGYGIHNNLHYVLGFLPKGGYYALDSSAAPSSPNMGVIGDVSAIRDPLFFRLHESVERLFHKLTVAYPQRSFKELAQENPKASAAVQIHKVGFAKASKSSSQPFEWKSTIQQQLHDQITVHSPEANAPVIVRNFTETEQVHLMIQLSSKMEATTTTTPVLFRVFMVPKLWRNEERSWIELDKFYYSVPAKAKNLVLRRDLNLSSVIAKPRNGVQAVPTELTRLSSQCGFPYHKLFPRSNTNGITYSLLVVASDYEAKDFKNVSGSDFNHYNTITAPSICGVLLKGSCEHTEIVDSRDLKYPIDRQGWINKFDETMQQVNGHSFIASNDFELVLAKIVQ